MPKIWDEQRFFIQKFHKNKGESFKIENIQYAWSQIWLHLVQYIFIGVFLGMVCWTLRSGLHKIPKMFRTFPHGEHPCMEVHFWQFARNNTYIGIPGKMSEIHLYVLLFSNPGEKVLKSINPRLKISPILLRKKGPFPMDWRTTMPANGFLTTLQECWHMCYFWRIVRNTFACMVVH